MIKVDTIINNDINFEIDGDYLINFLKINESASMRKEALLIADRVKGIVKPKYIAKKMRIDKLGNNYAIINGVEFKSTILARLIRENASVFAFIATSGREIENYKSSITDIFESYVLDKIAYLACLRVLRDIEMILNNDFNTKGLISIAPGSLPGWDIGELASILKLFQGEHAKIGVDVTDGGMINPVKSICGLFIESKMSIHRCEICIKSDCDFREAEFDENKFKGVSQWFIN
ncbi:MAG: hypothetical protein M0P77_07935 [Firmicutes bacterium]|nr:hypothetical protein [Bacillota bacterium]